MTDENRTEYSMDVPIMVFIFEDHWMCREALISVLSSEKGIEIVGASEDVQEGMKEVMKNKPDVVLMDVRFHGENLGIEATSTIKEKLSETKVIIFTDFPDEDTLRGAIKAGASGFLLKKEVQDPDIIVKAIHTVHHGDAYMTPSITTKVLKEIKRLTEGCKYDLTKRELQILKLIEEGKDNRRIANALNIDIRTVANHISNTLFKMNVKNRTEAAAIARKEGLTD